MRVKALAAVVVLAGALVALRHAAPASTQAASELVSVAAEESLQDALDRVRPGQTIMLEAGRTYAGPFVLRRKEGEGWITVRGPIGDARAGRRRSDRVSPADAPLMPRLTSTRGSVISVEPGARGYRLIGLEVTPAPGVFLTQLIDLGGGATSIDQLPRDFALERLYVHGDPKVGARRGVALNSAATTISDSYFADFKEVGADSQAICGWLGPGPYGIVNNYLEAAGENLMFGGGDPQIAGVVPSDIVISSNHLAKQRSWREAGNWTVKNLLELKNARRVLITGNVLEYSWAAAQTGFAVLFTPRNQDGGAPWSVVEDVSFRNNVIRHVGGGVHLLGRDDIHSSRQLQRVEISQNLFEDVGGTWGDGRLFQIIDGTSNVTIDHNTINSARVGVFAGETVPHVGFVMTNNILVARDSGVVGSGTGTGLATLSRYFPQAIVRRNVIVGSETSGYPADNVLESSIGDVGFADPGAGDYTLLPGSPLRGAGTNGADPGVDMAGLPQEEPRAVPRPRSSAAEAGPLAALFWISWGLVAYVYVGYPLLLWVSACTGPWPVRRARWFPSIAIVVVACNEARRIRRRIDDLLHQTYPSHLRQIVVVSDGSTDRTADEARAGSPAVQVIEQRTRQGKPAALNVAIPHVDADVVVLCDARQRFAPDAIEMLARNFADPSVGAVSGQLLVSGDEGAPAAQGVGMYWRYETSIRRWESTCGSSIGTTGAIAAIRRTLFEPIPADTVLDDLLIPIRMVRRGFRVVFEPRARAFDGLPSTSKDEFRRKVRTTAGTFQLLAREPWMLNPAKNPVWLQTLSHKALRLALPLLFGAGLATNIALAGAHPLYLFTLVLQGLFYLSALAAWCSTRLRRVVRWLVIPYTICFLNVVTVAAFVRFLRGDQSATWERAVVTEPA